MDLDRAKEKVAKLLALAQNTGATEGEAAHRGRGEADKVGFNKVIGGEQRGRIAA